MQDSENPYAPPAAPEKIEAEVTLIGGMYRIENTQAYICQMAWISLTEHYLRVKVQPKKLFFQFSVSSFLFILAITPLYFLDILPNWALPFPLILGLICTSLLHKKRISNIEFSLLEERLMIDSEKKLLGIKKVKQGKAVFIGAKAAQEVIDQVLQCYDCQQAQIQKQSLWHYQLFSIILTLPIFYVLWMD